MTAALRVELAPDELKTAVAAALWCRQFYVGVAAEVQGGVVDLRSSEHSETELRAMWSAASLNEQLVAEQRALRRAVMERLGQ